MTQLYWSYGFSGVAKLVVKGINDCGLGVASDTLFILVKPKPLPVITGNFTVCVNASHTYQTNLNPGNTYEWGVVSSGSITSGQGTNQINVLWGGMPGSEYVYVSETNIIGCTGFDIKAVVVDPCTGLPEEDLPKTSVFPNPATDKIQLQTGQLWYSYDITDISGKVVITANHTSPIKEIDISALKPGLYMIRLICGASSVHHKFVKQ